MPILTSRVRADGESVSTSLPVEVVRRMGIVPGDELLWVKDGDGRYHVTSSDPRRVEMLRVHDEIVEEHAEAFRKLAK